MSDKRHKIPGMIGHGEGGGHLDKLTELLEAAAKDLKEVFDEAGLDDSLRRLRMHDEDTVLPLEVSETSPGNEETGVAEDADIEITFDRDIKFADDEEAAKEAIRVYKMDGDDEVEHNIDSISIPNKVATLDLEGNLEKGETTYYVEIPVEDTFVSDDDFEEKLTETYSFSFTTVEE